MRRISNGRDIARRRARSVTSGAAYCDVYFSQPHLMNCDERCGGDIKPKKNTLSRARSTVQDPHGLPDRVDNQPDQLHLGILRTAAFLITYVTNY